MKKLFQRSCSSPHLYLTMERDKLKIIKQVSDELDLDMDDVRDLIDHYEHSIAKGFKDKERKYDKILMFGFGYFKKIDWNAYESKRDKASVK